MQVPDNDPNPDLDLMQRVASGEETAVAELYDRFGGLVYRGARQLLPSDAEAEDAVQEVFLRLWRTADRFDPERAKLVTWVMLITRRHVIDRIRRAAVRHKPSTLTLGNEPSSSPQPSQTAQSERNEQLMACLSALPEIQRRVIERAYLRGHTLKEVSTQLDMPLGTVKSALSRGLARLRNNASGDVPDWTASP